MPAIIPSVRRIDSLSEEQLAQLPFFRDKWIAIGLSTAPADRVRAESAIRLAYRRAGLKEPATLLWLGSPMAGAIGYAYLQELRRRIGSKQQSGAAPSVGASVRDSVWASVGDSVGASVGDSVRDSVWDSVGDSVWASVGASVWASVWASVRDSVWDSVWDSVRDSVWASVGDSVVASVGASVWASVWDSVGDSGYGQHDANWIGFIDVFRSFGLREQTEKIDGLTELTQSCGWYWPFQGYCILTERHHELRRDERGRLHSEHAAAVKYPDGWAIYAWHGVRVAEALILRPESITVANIQQEPNAEIRRVMLERYGMARYIVDSGARPVHTDEMGTLYRCELESDEPLVMVSVKNSTPEPDGSIKEYQLRVPPSIATARAAVAWTFNQNAKQYRPAVET